MSKAMQAVMNYRQERNEQNTRSNRSINRRAFVKKTQSKIKLKAVLLFAVIFLFGFSASILLTHANADHKTKDKYKYYTNKIVSFEESMDDIVDQYFDGDYYSSRQAYIDEICYSNHFDHADDCRPGMHIIVPYYAVELK